MLDLTSAGAERLPLAYKSRPFRQDKRSHQVVASVGCCPFLQVGRYMRGSAQFLDCKGLPVDLIPLALIQFGNFVNAGKRKVWVA
jgi:hypothetical protein